MDIPLVSIVTPVKNGDKYIEECINSVAGQRYPHIEHIIVDGGSTDRTLEIIDKYKDKVTAILATGAFIGRSLDFGFGSAKGDIFGWLDSDDRYGHPNVIRLVVDSLHSQWILFGDYQVIDEAGKVKRNVRVNYKGWKAELFGINKVHFASTFYRREVLESVGDWSDIGDFVTFFTRATEIYKPKYLPIYLSQWREHRESITCSADKAKRRVVSEALKQRYELAISKGANIVNSSRVRSYLRYRLFDRLGIYTLRRKIGV